MLIRLFLLKTAVQKIIKTKHSKNEGKNLLEAYDNDALIDGVNKAAKGQSTTAEIKVNKK